MQIFSLSRLTWPVNRRELNDDSVLQSVNSRFISSYLPGCSLRKASTRLLTMWFLLILSTFSRHYMYHKKRHKRGHINLLLTGPEGHTGEYWLDVVTTEGQYFPVRPEQARFVRSLLYDSRAILAYSSVKTHFRIKPKSAKTHLLI